ncbi:MAG: hypothetical protein JXP73_03115 [Deltaproteobacteria bacterium]|nr:hypothetical protein [Deltaproteobacteria bacterium]
MRTLAIVELALLSLAWPTQAEARARGRVRAESQDRAAKKACASGDFRKGVDILADLYVRTDDPTYIYNQGRCYEQNHQWVNAIDRFREYLRKTEDLPADVSADVEKHIAECKHLWEEENPKPAPQPEPPPPAVAPAPAAPPPAVVVALPQPLPPAPVASPGSLLRTTGVVIGSVGLAALAAGVGLNLKANSLADTANQSYNPDAELSHKSYKTGAIVSYGIGGAALLTGATLYLVGRWQGKSASRGVALVPTWRPDEIGLALSGEF